MAVGHQAAFLLEPMIQFGLRQRAQQPHHGGDDARALDEVELLLENILPVAVKPDNEPAHHLQARALEGLDRFHQVAALVLHLVAFLEAFGRGRFDADKDLLEAGLHHQLA